VGSSVDAVGVVVGNNVGSVVGIVVGDIVGLFVGFHDGVSVGDIVGLFVGFHDGVSVGDIVGLFVGFHDGVSVGGESEHKDLLKIEHHCPAVQISLLSPSIHMQSGPLTTDWPALSVQASIPAQLF